MTATSSLLDRILALAGGRVRRRPQLGVEITPLAAKLCRVRAPNGGAGPPPADLAVVVEFPSSLREAPPAERGAFLAREVERLGLRGERAALALPRERALVKYLVLPDAAPDELPALVRYQVEKESPFAAQSLRLGFRVLGPAEGGGVRVLAAAVERVVLDEHIAAAHAAGLDVQSVELAGLAAAKTYRAVAPAPQDDVAIAVVGARATEIVVCRGGEVALTRSAPVGAEAGRDALVQRLGRELRMTFRSEGDAGGGPAAPPLFVTGRGAALFGLDGGLAQALGVPSYGLFQPPVQPEALAPLLCVAYGLTLGERAPSALDLDLLAPEQVATTATQRRRRILIGAGAAAAVAAALLGCGQLALAAREAEVATLAAERDRLAPREKEAKALAAKVRLARAWVERKGLWLELLRELSTAFPKEAYLTSLSVGETERVRLSGRARDDAAVGALIDALNRSPLLGEAKFDFIRKAEKGDERFVEFLVTAKLKPQAGGAP